MLITRRNISEMLFTSKEDYIIIGSFTNNIIFTFQKSAECIYISQSMDSDVVQINCKGRHLGLQVLKTYQTCSNISGLV